ncbi:hypothetical protein Tco_0396514 [Tanacetum coccineum]
MEITVVTLVEEQMSSWKGNLPKLPIIIKYSVIGTRKYRYTNGDVHPDRSIHNNRVHFASDNELSLMDGYGEGRVMTRGFRDLVAKLGDKVVKEVLVRCWSDGDVVIVPAFLKELIYRVLGLLVPLLELNRFEILLNELGVGQLDPSDSLTTAGCKLLLVAGPLVHLLQRKVSSIPFVFSWGGSISPDSFLPSILLLLVIIVAVAIVVTIILVVVVVEGWANEFHQDKASSVRVPVANFTLQSSVQLLWENTDSVRSNQRMRPTAPSVPLKFKVVLSVFAIVAACASRAATTLSATNFLIAA